MLLSCFCRTVPKSSAQGVFLKQFIFSQCHRRNVSINLSRALSDNGHVFHPESMPFKISASLSKDTANCSPRARRTALTLTSILPLPRHHLAMSSSTLLYTSNPPIQSMALLPYARNLLRHRHRHSRLLHCPPKPLRPTITK